MEISENQSIFISCMIICEERLRKSRSYRSMSVKILFKNFRRPRHYRDKFIFHHLHSDEVVPNFRVRNFTRKCRSQLHGFIKLSSLHLEVYGNRRMAHDSTHLGHVEKAIMVPVAVHPQRKVCLEDGFIETWKRAASSCGFHVGRSQRSEENRRLGFAHGEGKRH